MTAGKSFDGTAAEPFIALLRAEADRQKVPVFHADFDMNLGSLRSAARIGDAWDDVSWIYWWDRQVPHLRRFISTTDAGRPYRIAPMTSRGTAIMVPGWYQGLYRPGFHNGYRALVQSRPAMFWRDTNHDAVLDDETSGPAKAEQIGANFHHGANNYRVGKYSAACQVVRMKADLTTVLGLVDRQAAAGRGDGVSYWLNDIRRSPTLGPLLEW